MGMDVDYLVAKDSIKELEEILFDTPHGEREEIADAIIELIDNFIKKWKKRKKNYVI